MKPKMSANAEIMVARRKRETWAMIRGGADFDKSGRLPSKIPTPRPTTAKKKLP